MTDFIKASTPSEIPIPAMTPSELALKLKDKLWRMEHLYKIIDKEANLSVFKLNKHQRYLYDNLHTRNVIPKSRQLGVTTFFVIYMLDDVLFKSNYSAVLIAHDMSTMKSIFEKVKIAWEQFPGELKALVGWEERTDNKNEIKFNNYSSFRVTLSTRGGTVNHLHVSELAKIAKEYPHKAEEIRRGAFPSVVPGGIISIESTPEGPGDMLHEIYEAGHFEIGKNHTEKDFKRFFFPWTDEPKYSIDNDLLYEEVPKDLKEYQKKHNLTNSQINWYYKTMQTEGFTANEMHLEYPTCIEGNQRVFTSEGIQKIKDIKVNGNDVINFFNQGVKDVYKLRTELGYELLCTNDHKIKTVGGFKELKDISCDDIVLLGKGGFNCDYQKVSINYLPFVESSITIDEDFARFLGYFMGDGSFTKNTIDFACCAEDMDVVDDVQMLLKKITGEEARSRLTGVNKGCVNLRRTSIKFRDVLLQLGVIKLRDGGRGYKRNVHVPEYIMRSPKSVVVEFLRGLFEADGFVNKNGNCIKMFTKYKQFALDVQLLLLNFGITSRMSTHEKISGNGKYKYIGYELAMRKMESKKFKEEIGFISKRKMDRLDNHTGDGKYNHLPLTLADKVRSVEYIGREEVYDITTKTHEFTVSGIVVHNCIEEAFSRNVNNFFNKQVIMQRMQNDIQTPINVIDNWYLYDTYNPKHMYGIGADPAEGVGRDHSAAVLIDFSHRLSNYQIAPKVIGRYKSNTTDPEAFASALIHVGLMYGNCIIGVERNNHGHAVLQKLKDSYTNIYKYRVKDTTQFDIEKEKYGWLTTGASKPLLLSNLRTAIDELHLIIPDLDILHELENYGEEDSRVIRANKNVTNHFDLVMALAIAWEMRNFATGSYTQEAEIVTESMVNPGAMFQV